MKKFKDNEMSGFTVLCLVLHAADMTHSVTSLYVEY